MLLKVQDIETWYGSAQALKGVSLKVESGEFISILGANGAGKTTLLRTISGLIEPKRGTIEFEGRRIDRMGAEEIVRLGVSHCPEGRKLFPQMTVHKNLLLGGYVRKTDQRGILDTTEEVFSLFPVLKDRREQLAGTLSGGEQQMLMISRGLMSGSGNLPSGGGGPIPSQDKGNGRLSNRQLNFILKLGKAINWTSKEIGDECVKAFGVKLDFLSVKEASAFIDILKAKASK